VCGCLGEVEVTNQRPQNLANLADLANLAEGRTDGRLVCKKVCSSDVSSDSEIELTWSSATVAFPYPLKPVILTTCSISA
jgi:hypothetical protein